MDPVEFRDIAYILAVSEEQGFSRAAEKYYISQPALSKTVRKAEQKLGVTLFDRGFGSAEAYTGRRPRH